MIIAVSLLPGAISYLLQPQEGARRADARRLSVPTVQGEVEGDRPRRQAARRRPRSPFPKKAQPPTHAEFAARLPAPVGKRFEMLRAFLKKQEAAEDLYYYGPRTGWAYRYMGGRSRSARSDPRGRLVGIVALDAAAQARVDMGGAVGGRQEARKLAHGTPALLWLDVPLDGTGAVDFKALLKAKLARRLKDRQPDPRPIACWPRRCAETMIRPCGQPPIRGGIPKTRTAGRGTRRNRAERSGRCVRGGAVTLLVRNRQLWPGSAPGPSIASPDPFPSPIAPRKENRLCCANPCLAIRRRSTSGPAIRSRG